MKVNGSLAFDASSASEIKNLRVEKYATMPGYVAGQDHGRLIFNSTTSVMYVGSDTIGAGSWVATATGGSAFSQAEGDAIEASLGSGINTDGTFNAVGFPAQAGLSTPTSFTDAINQIAAYATANNTLFEMDDVTLSQAVPTGAKFLYTAGGSNWLDHTLVLADVSNVTATAGEVNELHLGTAVQADFIKLHNVTSTAVELNVLTGIAPTLTATELSFVDGVTSGIQGQLDNKQPIDAGLTSLAALTGPGYVTVDVTGNVVSSRTFVNPAAGFTLSNLDGAGNSVFALANDLAGVEGLATTGYAIRTGDGTWTARSIAGTADRIVVTNGSGIASDTNIDLATVTQDVLTTGKVFSKISLDGYGRVIGNTPVLTTDITALVDATYVNVAGDTMAGTLAMGGFNITGLPNSPSGANSATSKFYVDSMVSGGASWRNPIIDPNLVDVVTVVPASPVLYGTYIAYGGSYPQTWGTYTTVAQGEVFTWTGSIWHQVDGPIAAGDRFIIAGESGTIGAGLSGVGFFNGDLIQYVAGDAALFASWSTPEGRSGLAGGTEMPQGTTVLCADDQSFHYGHTYLYDSVANIWHEIAGPGSIGAGDGLFYSGNVMNINMGAGIVQLPSDEVGIDLYDEPNGALILTSDGATHSTLTGSKLYLKLDAAGALAQTASGLKINAASVTNAMLVNSTLTINGDAGTFAQALGGTLIISGNAAQGVSSTATAGTVDFTVADASYSQKGVSQYTATEFVVTAGVVAVGVLANANLANSTITITGTAGSDPVALGESFAILGDGAAITTLMGANSLAITARKATAVLTGVASFATANFAVDGAGEVTLASSLDALSNVSTADAAATNSLLQKSAGDWVAVTPAAVGGTIALGDLLDVGVAPATTSGQALIADGSAWQAKKIYHLHTQGTAATSWTVTHGIGQQYCNVTIVDATDEVVIPQSITFNGTTTLTVTFNTAIAGKVVVMGIA